MFPEATKILIVDDSSFARTMLRNGLRDIGFHQILEASTASEAQMTLLSPEHESPPIGLIISDIHMPGMTGLELLRWVRQQPAFKGIALLLLTSSQDMNEIHEAGQAGVSHFLLKPLDVSALKDRMQHAWKKHGEAYFKARAAK